MKIQVVIYLKLFGLGLLKSVYTQKKTNLNLLSSNFDEIDWNYVNKLRSLIRGLNQTNLKHIYYRGLTLSEKEIQYYMNKINDYYYT